MNDCLATASSINAINANSDCWLVIVIIVADDELQTSSLVTATLSVALSSHMTFTSTVKLRCMLNLHYVELTVVLYIS